MVPLASSGPPIRLAFVITGLHVGGAETCLAELALRLDRERFAPTVYTLTPIPQGAQAAIPRKLAAADIPTVSLGATSLRHFGRSLYRLHQHFLQKPPQLVQTFLFHANVLGALAARNGGAKHVVAGIRVADPRSRRRLAWERRLTRNVARYVCVSRDVAEFSAIEQKLSRSKIVVIPNGVDVDRFATTQPATRHTLKLPEDRRILLFIGRLDRQKRVDRLLAIFDLIQDRTPQHDLVIVGDGPDRPSLEQQAANRSIASRVHFLGQRSDLPEILGASDLLLLTSDFEGMPNVVLEAMAAGKPVVSTDVQGVRELLGPSAGDQVVSSGIGGVSEGISDLAYRTADLANDRDRAETIGRSNQMRALRDFSYKAMVDAYQELYEQIVVPGGIS